MVNSSIVHRKWNKDDIAKARELRNKKHSYTSISRTLKIPRSTLHSWLCDIQVCSTTPEMKAAHLKRIQPLATQAIIKERQNRLLNIRNNVTKQVEHIFFFQEQDYLKSLLAMLYWAEGSKTRGPLTFANTDPRLCLLYITLLRGGWKIDESKLRMRLHLHYYHPIKKTKEFWSNLLGINQDKIGKIYIKPRSKSKKFRHNFAGICFIRYYDENLRNEILDWAFQIGDKITGYVPVAQMDRAQPCGG